MVIGKNLKVLLLFAFLMVIYATLKYIGMKHMVLGKKNSELNGDYSNL